MLLCPAFSISQPVQIVLDVVSSATKRCILSWLRTPTVVVLLERLLPRTAHVSYCNVSASFGRFLSYRVPDDLANQGCCTSTTPPTSRYEEWWIGPPSGNPTEMTEWRRPYRDTKAAPHDIWMMEQPVSTPQAHVWVDNGIVWGLPLYRLAGVYSPGNGEFSTKPFSMPSTQLWLNAEATWGTWSESGVGPWQPFARDGRAYDGNYVGGADEGRAAVSSISYSPFRKLSRQCAYFELYKNVMNSPRCVCSTSWYRLRTERQARLYQGMSRSDAFSPTQQGCSCLLNGGERHFSTTRNNS